MNLFSAKASYPHVYNNYEGLDFNVCDQDAATMYEFPIRESGELLAASAKAAARRAKVGNDRVLFQFDASTGVSTYCGMMTHSDADDPSTFEPCFAYVE